MSFTIRSPQFDTGERIPQRHAHPPEGEDVQPHLQWFDAPAGTVSLALLCEDPDAPQDEPFVHWVLAGIPAEREELVESEERRYIRGRNDFDEQGWGGPLPPEGHDPHRYVFKLYALDAEPTVAANRTCWLRSTATFSIAPSTSAATNADPRVPRRGCLPPQDSHHHASRSRGRCDQSPTRLKASTGSSFSGHRGWSRIWRHSPSK